MFDANTRINTLSSRIDNFGYLFTTVVSGETASYFIPTVASAAGFRTQLVTRY